MRLTAEQVAAHEAKFAKRKPSEFTPIDAGQEGALHRDILNWCRDNHCAVIHSHRHRKSSQTPGSPDFAIAAPGGRTLWVECKTKTGKVDEEQRVWHFLAERHLWPELYRLIRECKPSTVFGEQVAGPDALKWFDGVSIDLENKGYAVAAADLCAACVTENNQT